MKKMRTIELYILELLTIVIPQFIYTLTHDIYTYIITYKLIKYWKNEYINNENTCIDSPELENELNKIENLLTNINRDSHFDFNKLLVDAIDTSNIEKVKLLLELGADPNYMEDNRTCLISASILDDDIEIIKILLEYGADPNIADNENMTALHYAVMYDSYEIVKILLEHGADKTIVDIYNRSPIDLVKSDRTMLLLSGGMNVPTPKETIEIPEENEDAMRYPIEEGNTLVFLKEGYPDHRVVVKKADGETTEGWDWLVKKGINPLTNEKINLQSLNYRKVVRPKQGGRRSRKQTQKRKHIQAQR